MIEYAYTRNDYPDDLTDEQRLDYDCDLPRPPPGDGWRMCGCAAAHLPNYSDTRLRGWTQITWFWERDA